MLSRRRRALGRGPRPGAGRRRPAPAARRRRTTPPSCARPGTGSAAHPRDDDRRLLLGGPRPSVSPTSTAEAEQLLGRGRDDAARRGALGGAAGLAGHRGRGALPGRPGRRRAGLLRDRPHRRTAASTRCRCLAGPGRVVGLLPRDHRAPGGGARAGAGAGARHRGPGADGAAGAGRGEPVPGAGPARGAGRAQRPGAAGPGQRADRRAHLRDARRLRGPGGHRRPGARARRARQRTWTRSKQAALQDLLSRLPLSTRDQAGVGRVVRTRAAEWLPEVPDAVLTARPDDPALLARLREVVPSQALSLPLLDRGAVLGAVTVDEPSTDPADRALLETSSSRAAVALDNALLFQGAQRRRGRRCSAACSRAGVPEQPGSHVRSPSTCPASTGADRRRRLVPGRARRGPAGAGDGRRHGPRHAQRRADGPAAGGRRDPRAGAAADPGSC